MIQPFSFNVSRSNGSSVVAIAGEIDLATAPAIANVLNDFAQESVIVDLSAVTFIDSSGLAVLSDAHSRIRRSGGRLAIDCAQPSVRRVFEITSLSALFRGDSIDA